MNPIKVLIVDDHSLFRKGVRAVLEDQEGFEVVGEAGDGREGIRLAVESMPDIILMDINMPVCNGLEATREIKRRLPHALIVMLTVSETDEDLFEAVKNGAQGYLQKDVDAAQLGELLQRGVKGEALLSGLLAAKILKEFKGTEKGPGLPEVDPLTEREVEVLELVATGCSNREIAEKLVITENTVKHHLSNILDKLHLRNRIQLAVYSVQEGIVKKPS
jgi:DNA-binding NarL/FixJ family response regulator